MIEPDGPKVNGVSRMFDNERAILVSLSRAVTDDELRALHEFLRDWFPGGSDEMADTFMALGEPDEATVERAIKAACFEGQRAEREKDWVNIYARVARAALAPPKKAGPTPPALYDCNICGGLVDLSNPKKPAITFGMSGRTKPKVPAPAASDLRERAEAFVAVLEGQQRKIESKSDRDWITNWLAQVLAAIRAEAKAEGWDNAVKALSARSSHMVTVVTNWAAQASKWLATNRPTGWED